MQGSRLVGEAALAGLSGGWCLLLTFCYRGDGGGWLLSMVSGRSPAAVLVGATCLTPAQHQLHTCSLPAQVLRVCCKV